MTILLVDDSESDARLVEAHLKAECVLVATLEEARATLASLAPSAIVCDLNLGPTRGRETIVQLRQFAPGVPLLAISGVINPEVVASLIDAGADAALAKDRLAEVSHAIENAIAHRRRVNRVRLPTTRHHLERELFERASAGPEIFDFIQGGLLDGLWYRDVTNDDEWYSPGFVRALGYSPGEVEHTTRWWQRHIFPEDLELLMHTYRRHLEDASHPYDAIVRYRHKRGGTVWFRCHGLLLRDEAGRPIECSAATSTSRD